MKCDYLVVGAGLFGSVVAERLANEAAARVLVIDQRNHIGGCCHSQEDPETGIEFHTYGTHVFHTSSREAWDYVSRFAEFNGYRHQVLTMHRGKIYQLPINLATINSYYSLNLRPAEAREFLKREIEKARIQQPRSLEEMAISLVGRPLYEALLRGYTVKQWGRDPRELPPEIIARLPIRYDYDNCYFLDRRWQGVPLAGYTRLFERVLNSPRVEIRLNCDYFEHRDEFKVREKTVYTGPLDRYFDFVYGKLEWRSVEFAKEVHPVEDYQGTSVMNYADLEVPFTRIHEPRHLHPERKYPRDRTVIFYEKARPGSDEPYYPVNTVENQRLLQKYLSLADREKGVIIGGRLGRYAYIDMDKTILSALACYRENLQAR